MKMPLLYILALISAFSLSFTSPVLGFEFPDTSQWGSSTGAGLFSSYTPGNSLYGYPFSGYTRGTLIIPFG